MLNIRFILYESRLCFSYDLNTTEISDHIRVADRTLGGLIRRLFAV